MRKLGISIYPEKTDEKTLKQYIDKAGKAGFSRIFSCLLSVNEEKEKIKEEFKKIINNKTKEGDYILIIGDFEYKNELEEYSSSKNLKIMKIVFKKFFKLL